jgi:hypothetical protein
MGMGWNSLIPSQIMVRKNKRRINMAKKKKAAKKKPAKKKK